MNEKIQTSCTEMFCLFEQVFLKIVQKNNSKYVIKNS